MKYKLSNLVALIIILHISTAGGCKKDDAPPPPAPDTGTVTDADGNVYKTIKIGTQVWMAENLKTTKYRNGESINLISGQIAWSNLIIPKSPAYCYTEFNAANANIYGHLYNWHAVNDSRNIAPAGWHIPSDMEWATLIDFLGGKNTTTGNKLKATGTIYWKSPNDGNNSSGFTALAGGAMGFDGTYISSQNIGTFTTWWSATAANDPVNNTAFVRRIWFDASITATASLPNYGFSVRCIKD
jgi:uncharacterized protein (TIGR02145 family)